MTKRHWMCPSCGGLFWSHGRACPYCRHAPADPAPHPQDTPTTPRNLTAEGQAMATADAQRIACGLRPPPDTALGIFCKTGRVGQGCWDAALAAINAGNATSDVYRLLAYVEMHGR